MYQTKLKNNKIIYELFKTLNMNKHILISNRWNTYLHVDSNWSKYSNIHIYTYTHPYIQKYSHSLLSWLWRPFVHKFTTYERWRERKITHTHVIMELIFFYLHCWYLAGITHSTAVNFHRTITSRFTCIPHHNSHTQAKYTLRFAPEKYVLH